MEERGLDLWKLEQQNLSFEPDQHLVTFPQDALQDMAPCYVQLLLLRPATFIYVYRTLCYIYTAFCPPMCASDWLELSTSQTLLIVPTEHSPIVIQLCLRSQIGFWEKYYYAPLNIRHHFSSNVGFTNRAYCCSVYRTVWAEMKYRLPTVWEQWTHLKILAYSWMQSSNIVTKAWHNMAKHSTM